MRIVSWNIRYGFQSRIPQIMGCIRAHAPDMVVLGEFEAGPSGETLAAALSDIGLGHTLSSAPPRPTAESRQARKTCLGVLIAANRPVAEDPVSASGDVDPWHLLAIRCDGLRVMGVYLPWDDRKAPYWGVIQNYAQKFRAERTLIVGDFNTGLSALDGHGVLLNHAHAMASVHEYGYRDAWRDANPDLREYTWSPRRGAPSTQRLDFALASEPMTGTVRTSYSHQERLDGISDHSVMVVDLH